MNIINDTNVTIPQWVNTQIKSQTRFTSNPVIRIAVSAIETPSRYSGTPIGANKLVCTFISNETVYTVKLMQ